MGAVVVTGIVGMFSSGLLLPLVAIAAAGGTTGNNIMVLFKLEMIQANNKLFFTGKNHRNKSNTIKLP